MPTKGAPGVIHAALAQRSSPRRGRCTSTRSGTGVGPDQYRLRPTRRWARFRTAKAAVKMPRCSTCGATFRVLSEHLGWPADVHALALAGSRSHRHGRGRARPAGTKACKSIDLIASIRRRRIARGITFACHLAWTACQDYPELLRRIRFKDPESGEDLVSFITQLLAVGRARAGRWNASSSRHASIFGSSIRLACVGFPR